MEISEKILVANFKAGCELAFHKIFSKYYQSLFLFARKFVEEELAKDFVQDCFYELWQNRNRLEIKSSLSAYLFTIIRNRCYKYFQKEDSGSDNLSKLQFWLKQEEINYFLSSESSILEFDIHDRIQMTFDKLPAKCAEVFKESRLNGLKNREIAEKFHISIKTVEKHISKALRIFKEEFKDIVSILIVLLLQNFQ